MRLNYIPKATAPAPIEAIKYGAQYNWYAATDVRNISNAGWHVPTKTEIDLLSTYLGGNTISGGKLKETGFIYWDSPNAGATNESGFNGRGAGLRVSSFSSLNVNSHMWTETFSRINPSTGNPYYSTLRLNSSSDDFINGESEGFLGHSLRLIKDSTTLTDGQTGTYTDPSGFTYRTICIGTQEWVADNIKTLHYRNGDPIPIVTDNVAWATLTTGAMCYYNNDINNA